MIERLDSCYATVVGHSSRGLLLCLENGEIAFAFSNAIPKGTKVLATKIRNATERHRAKVTVDSLVNENDSGYGVCVCAA